MSATESTAERILHLERELVYAVACDDSAVLLDHPYHDDHELHIVARVSISEAHLVRSFYGVGAVRDEMPGLASRLAPALGLAVEIYGGTVSDEAEWPLCGCELLGCADRNGVVLPGPEFAVVPS